MDQIWRARYTSFIGGSTYAHVKIALRYNKINLPLLLLVIDSPRLLPPSLMLGGTYFPGLTGGGAPPGAAPPSPSAGGGASEVSSNLS